MSLRRLSLLPIIGALAFAGATSALAGRFSDVPDTHVYRDAIEHLADRGVVTGNPDGTFAPGKTVNRAEFLTMLYRAKGVTPSATAVCMRDVIAGSWYLSVVCDAVGKGYVGGYSDGTFRPQNPVNRVEAVKMLLATMEFPIGDYTEADRMAINYPDISLSAWYTKFIAAAFRQGILPVAGQSPNAFGPEAPLSRAEAAAYIDSALRVHDTSSSSSEISVSSESSTEEQSSSVSTRSSRSSQSSSDVSIKQVSFPMTADGAWGSKDALYHFTVSARTVGEITVTAPNQGRTVTCTLYKLGQDSLPSEYYVGSVDDNRCFLRVSMVSGEYQLQLHGTKGGFFSVASRTVQGDGNDSYTEAKTLVGNTMRLGALEVDDNADFYTFKVNTEAMYYIEMSNSTHVRCEIVPLDDVDIYGFATPLCDQSFLFPKGTYVVVIDRNPADAWNKQDYGVILKAGQK